MDNIKTKCLKNASGVFLSLFFLEISVSLAPHPSLSQRVSLTRIVCSNSQERHRRIFRSVGTCGERTDDFAGRRADDRAAVALFPGEAWIAEQFVNTIRIAG